MGCIDGQTDNPHNQWLLSSLRRHKNGITAESAFTVKCHGVIKNRCVNFLCQDPQEIVKIHETSGKKMGRKIMTTKVETDEVIQLGIMTILCVYLCICRWLCFIYKCTHKEE